MKVLVAGLPKTGTKTMNAALTLLGFGVYDWLENFWYLGDDWAKQIQEGCRVEDLRQMYENVDAVMDTPCDEYWEEILEAFPDVKVILTTRDDEGWFKSLRHHFYHARTDFLYRLISALTYSGLKAQRHFNITHGRFVSVGSWPFSRIKVFNEESLRRMKRKHERQVQQVVPKTQLLVYQVKEGWKPLCDFLDIEVPERPFPHKNKGASMMEEWRKENPIMQRLQKELIITLACLFAFIVVGIYQLI